MTTESFNNIRTVNDFEQARRKAAWRDWLSRLTGKKNNLLSFGELRQELPMTGQHYLGFQIVPLDKIVGSEGRFREFDGAFYPRAARIKDRWLRIDRAHYDDVTLLGVQTLVITIRHQIAV